MEKVLLNLNTATSAFFPPITVADFLRDCTFAENEREKRIKRLRVYIVPNRQAVADTKEQEHVDLFNHPQKRIKTIQSFGNPIGDRNDAKLRFRKWIEVGGQFQQAVQTTHVTDHIKAVFGGLSHKFDTNLKAVNVGTEDEPVWYPQEFLRILPYQMCNNILPNRLVESMLEIACKTPMENRTRIEAEGLTGLGIVERNGAQEFVSVISQHLHENHLT